MGSLKDLVIETIKLTDTVKTLDKRTQKLSDLTNDIDKRLIRLETIAEIGTLAALKQLPSSDQAD